jgi:glycosyltransferase involved in cell wall biosynthesis
MRVAVVSEHRFTRAREGVCTSGPFAYSFWKRYRTVFDRVCVVARVCEERNFLLAGVEAGTAESARADGPGVSFAALPCYRGPEQFLWNARRIAKPLFAALEESDAIILRLPSVLGLLAEWCLRRSGRPFAVEVAGDPWDALAPGAHAHPLRALFRQALARSQRRLCAASAASLYVTRQALQRRYPPRRGTLAIGCSDVELPLSAFSKHRRATSALSQPTFITVGSLHHLYKAQDVLLDAVARCRQNGLDARLVVVGDGTHRSALEQRCDALKIHERVTFRGHLPFGDAVRRELDKADLFILASRQEGLPRALLEAMARGLPAIGSTAGGIPELLPVEDLAPPSDAVALANKIEEACSDPARLEKMSRRNLATAHEYEETQLEVRRQTFLERVRDESKRWTHRNPKSRLAADAARGCVASSPACSGEPPLDAL